MDFIQTNRSTWVRISDVSVVWKDSLNRILFTLRGDSQELHVRPDYQKNFLDRLGIYIPDTEAAP